MNKALSTRRKVLGLSQGALAERAGVSQSLVSDVERGNRVKPELSEKVIQALGEAEREFSQNSRENSVSTPHNEKFGHLNEGSAHTAGTMADSPPNATPRLTLLTPSHGTPATGVSEEVQRALGAAFDAKKHLLADTYAVLKIAARLPLAGRAEKDLINAFRSYLDIAADLRSRSVEMSTEALLAEITFARGVSKSNSGRDQKGP